jgi:phosphatidate cytidylyltransferase
MIWIVAYFFSPAQSLAFISILLYASWLGFTNAFAREKDKKFWVLGLILYPTLPLLAMLDIYRDYGSVGLLWLIVIVAVCDTAAYFTGRAIGKIPFSPASPKKTLEGVIGGVIAATVIGALIGIAFLPTWKAILIAFIVAIAGVFGDLFESSLKRGADMKDSGTILPGHGGVLDRLDGHLFGAVALYALMKALY